MSATLFSTLVITAIHILWACGLLGDSGFALAADVNDVRRGQIEERLDRYYSTLCENPGEPNVLELIRRYQTEYRELNDGQDYDPPTCELLLKLKE